MVRILVTGATGFLGGALVRKLSRDGVCVVATGRNRQKLDELPLPGRHRFAADLNALDPADFPSRLDGVTTIIHCAALSSPWGSYADFHAANITATERMIALAKGLKVEHFIHVSTPAVYFRFEDQLNVIEDMPLPAPVNAYAHSKGIAENKVAESGLPYTIVRPRGIYGAGDNALLPRLLRAARIGPLPRFRQGRAVTDITHVDDVVDALCAIVKRRDEAAGRVFNISGGEALSIRTIVERVGAASSTEIRWRDLPIMPVLAAVRFNEFLARLHPRRPEPRVTAYGLGIFAFSQTLDLSNARRRLAWRPKINFEEGLGRTFRSGSVRAS